MEYRKAKVDAGAEFIVTQLFYDVDQFRRWVKKVRAKGLSCLTLFSNLKADSLQVSVCQSSRA